MTAYGFGREFRMKMLALLLLDTWVAKYGCLIVPEYFDQEDEASFAQAIITYRAKYNQAPDDPYDVIELMDGKHSAMAMDVYDGRDKWNLELASDKAIQFAKEQAARLAILEGVDDIEKGDVQSAIARMKAALDVGEDFESPGLDPFDEVDYWLYDYWEDKIPTGWLHVDQMLEGGLAPGELGIVMGPQNRGKSMCLVNIGYSAASLLCGANVVHFTHEMSVKQVAKRYAARVVFRFPKRGDDLQQYAEELVMAARRLLKGRIRIIGGAKKMTTQQVQSHLDRLLSDNFKIDLIVDDYIDLIIPPRIYKDRRYELSALYEWYRSISDQYHAPVWSASQANRPAFSKEVISLQDIAEDIGKASTADVILSLCMTMDEERIDRCRLFGAKVRDGSSRFMVEAKYYGLQQAIISTGFAEYKKREEDDA